MQFDAPEVSTADTVLTQQADGTTAWLKQLTVPNTASLIAYAGTLNTATIDGVSYNYVSASTATADGAVVLAATGKGSGRWVSQAPIVASTTQLRNYAGIPSLLQTADGTYWKYDATCIIAENLLWCVTAVGKSGGRWLRQKTVTIDVRDYGALAQGLDSITIDTVALNAALAAAATAAPASNGIHSNYGGVVCRLYIPAGWYLVNDELLVSGSVHIFGDGSGSYAGTNIQQSVHNKHLFKLVGENTCVLFEKMRLQSSFNGSSTPQSALIFGPANTNGHNSIYSQFMWYQGGELAAFHIEKGNDIISFRDTYDGSNNWGVILGSTTDIASQATDVSITNGTVYDYKKGLVQVRNVKNLLVANMRMFAATGGISECVVDAQSQNPLSAKGIKIANNICERVQTLYKTNTEGASMTGNVMHGCSGTPAVTFGGTGLIRNVVVTDNTFEGDWSGNIPSTTVPITPFSADGVGIVNGIIANNIFRNTGTGATAIWMPDARSTGTIWGPNTYEGFADPVNITAGPPDGTPPNETIALVGGVLDLSKTLSAAVIVTGTGPITGITWGYPGQRVTLYTNNALTVNSSASLYLTGGRNVLMTPGHTLSLYRLNAAVAVEVGRSASIDTSFFFVGDTAASLSQFKTNANADLPSGPYTVIDTTNMPTDPSGFNAWYVYVSRFQDNTATPSFWAHQRAVNFDMSVVIERVHNQQTDTWSAWRVITGVDIPVSLTYAAATTIDLSKPGTGKLALTGNVTFATSNRISGAQRTIRITADATARTFTFPAGWVWVGSAAPTGIAAGKVAILSLQAFGTTETDIIAAYAVQP